jgi:hypothetical protein
VFQNYSFNDGLSQWTNSGAVAYPGAVQMSDGDYIEQTVYSDGGYYLHLTSTIADGAGNDTDGTATIYYQITRFSDSIVIGGGTISANEAAYYANGGNLYNYVSTYEDMSPGWYTIRIQAQLASVSAINLLSACFTELPPDEVIPTTTYPEDNFAWAECGDVISPPANPLNIGSWIGYLWSSLIKWFICSLEPILNGIWNAITGLGTLLSQLFSWLWSLVDNIWDAVWWLITRGWQLLVDTISLIWDTVAWLLGLLWQIIAFGRVALNQIFMLFNLWNSAVPTAPPGVPDCVAAPLDSNICAVYYITEHTILSGPIGSLFIPAIQFYISVEIASWLIVRVFAMFGQGVRNIIGGGE